MNNFITDSWIAKYTFRYEVNRPPVRLLFLLLLVTKVAFSEQVPSYFAFEISPPAGVPAFVNPSSVYYDHRHREIYVADTGNDRVVIFDKNGNYLYEFSDGKHLASPRTLAVDSGGHILVLSERQRDRLEVFDFNGTYLRQIMLPNAGSDSAVSINSFALGKGDTLYALSELPPRIFKFSIDGTPLGAYDILLDLKPAERAQQVLGSIAYANGLLIVPTPMYSQLEVHDTQGKLVSVFGFAGGGPGKLSFPVAATSDGQGGTLVLDKHRHTVLQYGADGMFIQELGGMGMSLGWFYHPVSLATDDSGHCFVLQAFLGRVQAVKIPVEKAALDTQISVAKPDGDSTPARNEHNK